MAITKNLRNKVAKYNLDVPTYKRSREYKDFLIQLDLNDEEYEFLLRETVKNIEKEERNKLKQIKKFYDKVEKDLSVLVNPATVTVNYKELRDIRKMTTQDYFRAIKTIFNFAKNYSNNNNRIVYKLNGDDETYYTINDAFIDSIGTYRIVSNANGISGDDLLYRGIYVLENNPIDTITFKSIERTNKYNTAEGAYFPYFCPYYDLSRYQIFKDTINANLNDNCLIYALKLLGLDEFKLDLVKTAINNNYVCKSRLKDITIKIKIQINLYEKRNDNNIRLTKYGNTGKVFNIALFQNHYFIYEKYDDTNSLSFIKYLFENKDKYLIPFDYNNLTEEQLKFNNIKFSENLDYDDSAIKEKSFKNKSDKYDKIIFADFETYTKGSKLIHIPYLLSFKYDDSNEIKSFTGINCAKSFINYLNKRQDDKNILIIFHNAKYDFNFLTKEIKITKEINSDGNFKSISGYTSEKIKITIKCSYNLFNLALKKCPKAFMTEEEQKLIKKEVMPYKLYNVDGYINKRFIPKKDINVNHFNNNNKDDYKQFFINAEEWNCYDPVNNTIDIIEYSRIYCEMDILILSKSYNKFRDWVLEGFNLDINNYLTISSIADAYFTKNDCYNGVNQISLNVQDFIMKSVYGGRVMTRRNEKIYKEGKINDFDAVSLYPSAMRRLGFPMGNPKVIKDLSMEFLKTTDAYFVEIEITKVGIKRDFPILCKYDNEIRNYTNDMIGEKIVVNNITLEDLIKFHNIEFNLIKGYYYNEGLNYKIQEVIQFVFDKRAQLKKDKNSAEIIYKLLMNSAYGKTIQKPHLQDYDFIYGDDKLGSYVSKNYNKVVSYRKIPDSNGYKMVVSKSSYGHYNLAHIGSLILSMSKRIMNEVMCLAEDNGIDIYYQDTDSMHLNDCDIPKLEKLFKETYNRDLIGKKLGQFHSDFSLENAPSGVDVYSKKLIALGKKCYIDVLEANDNNGKIYNGYHIRLKGVSGEAIEYEAKKRNISELDIYELLYKGEEIEFDLTCENEKSCFKFEKNYLVHTQTDFKRKIAFPQASNGRNFNA